MALSADGANVYTVWLNVKNPKRQMVQGAWSTDGGVTWSKNTLIYNSSDGSVCECCKPSVVVQDNDVYVQFRNWLYGNRDLCLTASNDDEKSFGKAQKLG